MKCILALLGVLAITAFSAACEFNEDCIAGTVCCSGECQTGTVCCSYGACNSIDDCCTAGDQFWPACCPQATSKCCKNYAANWCCPNTMRCGSYFESCRRYPTTTVANTQSP